MNTQTQNQTVAILNLNNLIAFSLGNSRSDRKSECRSQLRESIKNDGVIFPITVRPCAADENKYEVIAGFGRWEESAALGFLEIPALIKNVDDKQAFEIQLAENLIRESLSLVDEAKAAQKWISFHEGNHKQTCNKLGWNEKKLKDRLQLLKCSDTVLKSLNEEKIKLGHAIILSSFSETLQTGTLKKILDENWSVQLLKERAAKAKKYLKTAKFDIKDCAVCPHNTAHQMGMFDEGIEKGACCAKLSCWKEKTESFLETKKLELEVKYGKVLYINESNITDRSTVSKLVVGNEQFNNGCSGCESKVAILDNRSGKEGEVIESQCLDKVCFAKCTKKTSITSVNATKNPKEKDIIDHKPSSQKVTQQKTPNAVLNKERNDLRLSACEKFKDSAWLKQGVVLASLISATGYKSKLLPKATDFNSKVLECTNISQEELQLEIHNAIKFFTSESKTDDGRNNNAESLMIKALSKEKNKKNVAIEAWKANKETLENYTVSGLIGICEASGFDSSFNTAEENIKSKLTFTKVSKKGKSDFIKSILDFNHDWSSFAPSSMLKHIS